MRHGASGRRSRNRGHGGGNHHHHRRSGGGGGGPQNRMHVFDSNGPDVRIRGTAYQICEKYQNLARDASSQGNLVLSESYLQHAEHYQRIINAWAEADGFHDRQPVQATPQEATVIQPQTVGASGEADLGLPASIIGAPVAKTPEMADA
jgi:hypothetical protein